MNIENTLKHIRYNNCKLNDEGNNIIALYLIFCEGYSSVFFDFDKLMRLTNKSIYYKKALRIVRYYDSKKYNTNDVHTCLKVHLEDKMLDDIYFVCKSFLYLVNNIDKFKNEIIKEDDELEAIVINGETEEDSTGIIKYKNGNHYKHDTMKLLTLYKNQSKSC